MTTWSLTDDDFDDQFEAGRAAESAAAQVEPRAARVQMSPETDALIIEFRQGYTLTIPVRLIPELATLPPDAWESVTIVAEGEGLEWPQADVHLSVPGLLWRLIGSPQVARQAVAEAARRAASVRSEARAEAARKNGKKGGRPRKQVAEQPASTTARRQKPGLG